MHIIIKKQQRFSVTVIYCDLEMAWFSVHSSEVGCAGCWHLHLYKTAKIYYMSASVCVCVCMRVVVCIARMRLLCILTF